MASENTSQYGIESFLLLLILVLVGFILLLISRLTRPRSLPFTRESHTSSCGQLLQQWPLRESVWQRWPSTIRMHGRYFSLPLPRTFPV